MQDFFRNVSRYPRYMITFVLGVFWSLLKPLLPLLKKPFTAVALVGVLVGGLGFIGFTLRAMLGLPVA
jgi:type II secretory pathway component PulF